MLRGFQGRRFLTELALIVWLISLISPTMAEAEGGKVPVVIAIRPLGLHHVITEEDVKLVYREKRDSRTISDPREVIGKEVRRPIGKNNVVKRNYLKEAPLVKRGSLVILIAEKGNLKVSTKGLAREDGGLGAIIRVENVTSGKIVTGRIVEPGVVAVDF